MADDQVLTVVKSEPLPELKVVQSEPLDAAGGQSKWADDLAKNPDNWKTRAEDVATGVGKGVARTVNNVLDLPTMFGGAGGSDYVDLVRGKAQGTTRQQLADLLKYKNTAQKVGGYGETAAEMLIPAGMAVKAGLAAEAGSAPGAVSSILDASGKPMQMAPEAITYGQRLASLLSSAPNARNAALLALKYGLPGSASAAGYALAKYLLK